MSTLLTPLRAPNSSSMFIEPRTADEIVSIINDLKNSKGTGVDDFLTSVIKSVSLNIADRLTHICNAFFRTGIFPDMLKYAKVVPIYKTDDKLSITN